MNIKTLVFSALALPLSVVLPLSAQTLSVEPTIVDPYSPAQVSYSQLPEGAHVYLYQGVSLLPMQVHADVVSPDSTFSTLDLLEPGNYVVRAQAEAAIDSTFLTVRLLPLADTDKSAMLLSDIHVMAPELIVSEGAALSKVVDADRKMLVESARIFDALVDSILTLRPKMLLISGDLTKDGEKVSHEYVAAGLQRLLDAGIPSFVIPGNHDVSNPMAAVFDGDERRPTETVSADMFRQIYSSFGYNAGQYVQDTASLSYIAEPLPGLCLLAIDATQWQYNTSKTEGADADYRNDYGKFRESTLQWVLDRADEAKAANKRVVAMMHHQLVQHFDGQAEMMKSAAVEQGDSIARVFMEHDIHLVMTGHMHITNISTVYNKAHTDSLTEITSGSTLTYPVAYRWLAFSDDLSRVEVNTRQVNSVQGIDDFAIYSRDHYIKRIPIVTNAMVNSMSSRMLQIMKQAENVPGASHLLSVLPDTPQGMAQMLDKYMADVLVLSILTVSEGNENNKLYQLIVDMIDQAFDRIIDDVTAEGFTPMERFTYKNFFKPMILSYLNTPMYSMLTDCTNYGTADANTTNDLYASLAIGSPLADTNLCNWGKWCTNMSTEDDAWYDMLGRRFVEKPTWKGIFIHQGKKVQL